MTPLLVLSATLVVAADQPGVAFALEVKGSAAVERAGRAVPLEDGDALRDGDKLTVAPGGAATVFFRPSGPVAVLTGPADARILAGKLDTTAAVAVREVKVPAGAAAGLDRDVKAQQIGGTVFRPAVLDEPPPAVHPAVDRAMLDDTPDFSWPAASGATGYRLELYQVASGGTRRVWTADPSGPTLAYPADKKPLPRGRVYSWRVTTKDGAELVVPDKRFVVLDAAQAAAAAGLAALERGSDPNDWLLAATAYSGLSLTDEPIRVLRKLAAVRPGSALVCNMLAEHLKAAGLTDEAKTVKATAKK